MTAPDSDSTRAGIPRRVSLATMLAIAMLSASMLSLEIVLTKFFASKLEYHFTFAIISITLLGLGAGGVFVQVRSPNPHGLWRYASAFAVSAMLATLIFVLLPLSPSVQGIESVVALSLYFVLFASVFFFAGVVVSAMLASPTLTPSSVYAWDLVGAGLGAGTAPFLLSGLGGYWAVVCSSALSLAAAFVLQSLSPGDLRWRIRTTVVATVSFVAAACLLVGLPALRKVRRGLDILSVKGQLHEGEWTPLPSFVETFGGAALTYWNPIARIDVSHTATSEDASDRALLWGLPPSSAHARMQGRLLLVDYSAPTRQLALRGMALEMDIVANSLWAVPYVLHGTTDRSLVIGVGGGVDVLVAKTHGVRQVDALELNEDTFRLLVGRADDPERDRYVPWLQSDARTQVTFIQGEARHFAHARDNVGGGYDVVLASGVDTLTAVESMGNALSENFLYTSEAVEDYLRLLNPGGILGLTHWRVVPYLPLRMLATYLDVLERAGVTAPSARVIVLQGREFDDTLVKKGSDFTREEVERLRVFADRNEYRILYAPFVSSAPPVVPEDPYFVQIARADRRARRTLLDSMPVDATPATDDRPYFYWLGPAAAKSSPWDVSRALSGVAPLASIRWMLLVAIVLACGLGATPVWVARRRGWKTPSLRSLAFFVLTGAAFLLAENAVFLKLMLFLGGPLYSLSVVLPSVLVGYGFGSALSRRWFGATSSGVWIAVACLSGFGMFAALAWWATPVLLGLGTASRVVVAVASVVPFGAVLGLAVPWYMDKLRSRAGEQACLPWMWAVSSAANVIASLLFVPICHAFGVRLTYGVSALLYAIALLLVGPAPEVTQRSVT